MGKEQLAQLYRELEETGEAIKPLLETDLTTSCTSSSSYSAGEESEDTYINNQKQRQVRFERYAIIYGEDSPMPPSLKKSTNRTDYSSSGANTTGNGNKKKSSKNSPEDSSSSLSSTGQSQSSSSNDRQKRSSTSLGSSSAITVGSRPTSSEDDQKGNSGSPKVDDQVAYKSTEGKTEHPEKN